MASPNENTTQMKTDPSQSNTHLESDQGIHEGMSQITISNPTTISTPPSSSGGNILPFIHLKYTIIY